MQLKNEFNTICAALFLMIACGGSYAINAMERETEPGERLRLLVAAGIGVNDQELARLLVEQTINQTDANKMTALHFAAQNGRDKMCELLLNKGANVNAVNNDGDMALHLASAAGHENVIIVLLKHESIEVNMANNAGQTSLDRAQDNRISELLLEKGALVINRSVDKVESDSEGEEGGELFHSIIYVPSHAEEEAFRALVTADDSGDPKENTIGAGLEGGSGEPIVPTPDASSADAALHNVAIQGAPKGLLEGKPVKGKAAGQKVAADRPSRHRLKSAWKNWLAGSVVGAVVVGGVAYAANGTILDIKKFLIGLKSLAEQKQASRKKEATRA